MKPWEYDRLQPFEVLDLEEAARWRVNREWERQVLIAATLLMPHTEKGSTLADTFKDIVRVLPGYEE